MGRSRKYIPAFLFFLFPLYSLSAVSSQKVSELFPSLLLCQGGRNSLAHIQGIKADWEYLADGPILDAQPQAKGRYLVVGGNSKVFLIRPTIRGYRKVWDWSLVEGVQVVSAVAVDWDLKGNPSLILAADSSQNRIFLSEAKSQGVKIRWEYKLPATPLSVRLCPDSGNFLVTLSDSTIEEIFYQKDQVVWAVGKEEGLQKARDAARGSEGWTFVADGAGGMVYCFDHEKKALWKTRLPFIPACDDLTVSPYRKNGKKLLLVTAHAGSKNILYLLSVESGKLLGWEDSPGKANAALLRAVPDMPPSRRPGGQ